MATAAPSTTDELRISLTAAAIARARADRRAALANAWLLTGHGATVPGRFNAGQGRAGGLAGLAADGAPLITLRCTTSDLTTLLPTLVRGAAVTVRRPGLGDVDYTLARVETDHPTEGDCLLTLERPTP